ncbi:MAG TPA: tetratricopeptide repeat protein [Terriglobia bacterium]|nr:tetratricopeptide repeat protein [Terriglobia bacterium]
MFLAGVFSGAAVAQSSGTQTTPSPANPNSPRTVKAKVPPEFQKIADQASQAREANQDQQAINLYLQALKLNPSWNEGWWYLGTLYYDGNQFPEGVGAFHNLVEMMPDYGAGWAMLGLCESETHDIENAYIHLQMGRAKGMGDNKELIYATRYHQALIDLLLGNFEEANSLLSSLVTQNVLSTNVKQAMGLALLRVQLQPNQIDPSKDALVSAAGDVGELEALGDFDEAKKAFEKMIHDYPSTPFVHYSYGVMLAELSQYKEAEQQLLEEIKVNPDSSMPYMQVAYVYIRTSRYEDALGMARKATQLVPGSFAAHYLAGRSLLEVGQVNESIQELNIAKRLAPTSPEVRYSLARALSRAHRPQEAAKEQEEFKRLNARVEQAKQKLPPQSFRESNDRGDTAPHEAPKQPGTNSPQ